MRKWLWSCQILIISKNVSFYVLNLGTASPISICCQCRVHSLVFVICNKIGVSLSCDSFLWEERLWILDRSRLQQVTAWKVSELHKFHFPFLYDFHNMDHYNSSDCNIAQVDACCFATVNREIPSCTNCSVYHHQCH